MLYITLLIIFLICGLKKQPQDIEQKYTSDKFLSLRGILAMQVVFGHTWPDGVYNNQVIDRFLAPFNNTGYLCVAVFFFLSGFGTYESSKKRNNYFEHFIKNKVIKIFFPYWIINCLYILMLCITNSQVNINKMLISFIWPVYNTSAWYVFTVFIVYLCIYIYILLTKVHTKKIYFYIYLAVCIGIYTIIAYFLHLGTWWYVSTFAALAGVIFSDFKEEFAKKFPTLICGCLFSILYVVMVWNKEYLPHAVIIPIKILTSVMLPLTVCGIMKRKRFESRLFSYIGKCSYEIYLTQGLFVLYFRIELENKILSSELTSLLSILFAVTAGCIIHNLIFKFRRSAKS